jgi:hypothetical protein
MVRERSDYCWSAQTVNHILDNRAHCGDIVSFKSTTYSYKNKKRIRIPEEEQMVFEDRHEPIVSREEWMIVQNKRKAGRKKPAQSSKNILSGLVRCADCGTNLHFHFNQGNHDITFFSCGNYYTGLRTCNATHYVRADFLEKVLLKDVRRIVRYAEIDEEGFAKLLMEQVAKETAQTNAAREQTLATLTKRYDDLDRLIRKVYEDNAAGKISDDRMTRFMSDYEAEQAELHDKIEALEASIETYSAKDASVESFVQMVRQHSSVKRLTRQIVNRFIDHIVVYHAERIKGGYNQRIEIYYNCVGNIALPEIKELPEPDVAMKTRKGVVLSYSPALTA